MKQNEKNGQFIGLFGTEGGFVDANDIKLVEPVLSTAY